MTYLLKIFVYFIFVYFDKLNSPSSKLQRTSKECLFPKFTEDRVKLLNEKKNNKQN